MPRSDWRNGGWNYGNWKLDWKKAGRKAALGIKDFDGALGKWSFDANGDTSMKVLSGNVVKDG